MSELAGPASPTTSGICWTPTPTSRPSRTTASSPSPSAHGGLDIVGIQPTRGELLPPLLSGRLPQADDEIVLGKLSATRLGVGLGDEFEVTTETGPHRLRVTGLVVIPSVEQGRRHRRRRCRHAGRAAPPRPDCVAEHRRSRTSSGGSRRHRRAPRAEFAGYSSVELQPTARIVNLDRIRSIPWLVAAVLATFAMLSLAHQLVVSARHRRRDLGVLKALGANRGFVSEVVHVQATVFTAAVIVIAIPIGVIAGQSVYRFITDSVGARGGATVPASVLLVSIIATVLVANLVALSARTTRSTPAPRCPPQSGVATTISASRLVRQVGKSIKPIRPSTRRRPGREVRCRRPAAMARGPCGSRCGSCCWAWSWSWRVPADGSVRYPRPLKGPLSSRVR